MITLTLLIVMLPKVYLKMSAFDGHKFTRFNCCTYFHLRIINSDSFLVSISGTLNQTAYKNFNPEFRGG